MKAQGYTFMVVFLVVATMTLISSPVAPEAWAQPVPLAIKKIYFEYNSTASLLGDLGVHIFLDGEDWKKLKIIKPNGVTLFEVEGRGPYRNLGMTELFFEGAEPDLADVPLEELLRRFPEGDYRFVGRTVDGIRIKDTGTLTHAIPAGPSNVDAALQGNSLVISWDQVTSPPVGFPDRPINIVGYQVIVGDFQVTVPPVPPPIPGDPLPRMSVTVSPEFVASLASGLQLFEVLAIEAGGNQTITEGSFTK